ncbi:phytoene synthase [Oceanicola sp. 22II-s10i]|uniref:squalene/phytoene synthase family protein n=1 Tax=Oceanicola sp. 22II-s10i TaxID=1317116 RepID=UPI000B52224D|nr:squalene/phytoene synthase family protein [Oceanicola sp. 22II-s10i]OWU83911.1 phytoene synthase [Oceanicola sp. 22II-s10i]
MASVEFDTNLTSCAQIVERADPHRFRAAMVAPVEARVKLFPLYAFNVEVARAPWVTKEAMIAEMRLQWWRDALEEIASGGQVRRHEVVTPLSRALEAEGARLLDGLIEARRTDLEHAPFGEASELWSYLDATSGLLMQVAARMLGAQGGGEAAARKAGTALGLANWFRAIPALEEAGRHPLPDGRPEAVAALATQALGMLAETRRQRAAIPAAAMLPLAGAVAVLKQAARRPGDVAAGLLEPGAFRDRAAMAWQAATGRW